jgi:hypothetical protein
MSSSVLYMSMSLDGVTFLDCDVAEAVRIGLDAADGKSLEIFSPSIGTPLLECRDQPPFPHHLRELTPKYRRSTGHVTRPRPQLLHLTRRLRHR